MTIDVRLLGGFQVVVDGTPVPSEAWSRRHAASLVKLLALAPGRRLHREQVLEALWPRLPIQDVAPRLHKATHFARRALGPAAVVSRSEMLLLSEDAWVDVDEFRALAGRALDGGSADAVTAAIGAYRGPLLPDDLYAPWTEDARYRLGQLHLDLLRRAGRWDAVLHEQPADEQAHLALMQTRADRGDVRGALRQYERMDQALRRELGTVPSPDAQRLRDRIEAGLRGPPAAAKPTGRRLFGRRDIGDLVRERLDQAADGRGSTLLFTGPPGVGKSAVLDLVDSLATRRGWRVGRGTASAVEEPWPYAPVLEALNDLCRKHHALLDGLDDAYRVELERALSGQDVSWSGESGHQRLFVAAAELVRLAAAGHGLAIVVDDVHEADDASLRLLHYLARCAMTEPVLIALAHRPLGGQPLRQVAESLVARGTGTQVPLAPLSESAIRQLLAERYPDLSRDAIDHAWAASGGLPFIALELGRSSADGTPAVLPVLPAAVQTTFARLALLGSTFSTDELLAVSGVDEDEAYHQLDVASGAMLVERADTGYRFRHALVRDALRLAMPPGVESAARREVAEALAATGAPPGRVARQFLAAGLAERAVPYALRAVETAGALGAYRDGLSLVDAVRQYAGPAELPRLLARRGDLLLALGDPAAVAAYREAVAVTQGTEHRFVRARLARAAGFAGDLDTARAALAGLTLEGDAADGTILRAQGNLAYFSGDVDTAWKIAGQAREMLESPSDPWHLVDLVTLQGLIAHNRGEWFERFRLELRRTQGKERLVTALFDAHLCVAEYLLYGTVPYAELIADTEELRRQAAQAGALRGVAFATALIGEAAMFTGDLERAERELVEAVDLHRDVDAPAGEAHGLQRLAEVRLAQGDKAEAERLLQRALPLARWSVVASHLLYRIYGTMIAAMPDPATARAVVDRAEATLGETDRCVFCQVMLSVPATIACADYGDIDEAHRHLRAAERSAARWEASAWQAAICEARAHVVRAEGRDDEFADLLVQASRLYRSAGHHRDAARCAAASADRAGLSRIPS
ncbi:MAG TPA: AAA family ATPase [Jatrophihabitantaceae bacterium]|jgi:DNA-binding SARP family transcriptional activator/tetratricopeptide (TPR) repeat protein